MHQIKTHPWRNVEKWSSGLNSWMKGVLQSNVEKLKTIGIHNTKGAVSKWMNIWTVKVKFPGHENEPILKSSWKWIWALLNHDIDRIKKKKRKNKDCKSKLVIKGAPRILYGPQRWFWGYSINYILYIHSFKPTLPSL